MSRQTAFKHREQVILDVTEHLLLESINGDLTLDTLATHLNLAKGTLYKHFTSKDELFMKLLIRHEHKRHALTLIQDSASAALVRLMLTTLLNPTLAILYVRLEERLSDTTGLKKLFDELYDVRYKFMDTIASIGERYLAEIHSQMPLQDFLVGLWSLTQGGAIILNSSFNQRYLGPRDVLIFTLIEQALALPKITATTITSPALTADIAPKNTIHPSVNLPLF